MGRQPVQGVGKADGEPLDGFRLGLQEPVGRRKGTVGQVPVLRAQGHCHVAGAVVQQLLRRGLGNVDILGFALAESGHGFIQRQAGEQVQLRRLDAVSAHGELERGPGHWREPHGDQFGVLQRLPPEGFRSRGVRLSPAQDEEPVPGIDLGEVDRDRFGPPIRGDDRAHYAALSDVRSAPVQGAHGVGELGRASLEVDVQALLLQESTGHRDVDRGVEQGTEGLDEPQRQPVAGGSQDVSLNILAIFWQFSGPGPDGRTTMTGRP